VVLSSKTSSFFYYLEIKQHKKGQKAFMISSISLNHFIAHFANTDISLAERAAN